MLQNAFLTSFRSLLKNRGTFLLNLLALTIGIAACVVAYLHINYELSFDQYHSKKSRIFRVVTGNVAAGEGWVKVSSPIPPTIEAQLPEVESYARLTKFSYNDKVSVEAKEAIFNEENVFLADPSLFSIFDIPPRSGAFSEDPPENVVYISSSIANKYFPTQDPIGEVITIDGRLDFEVAAVFQDIPSNSHFDLELVVPFDNLETALPNTSLTGNWGQFNYFAYVLLGENASQSTTDSKIKEIVAEYGDNQSLQFENLGLQALGDIHFQENRGNLKPAYSPRYLVIYAAVAGSILLISFINFINLSVASSTKRIKEVGVRKVLGASRSQLITQFVTESIITATLSASLALLLTNILMPYINGILQSNISPNLLDPLLLFGILTLIVSIALFSGLYISLYILSFNPLNAVKGVIKVGNKGKRFKEALMLVQFTVSCVLILSSVFIYKQLNFLMGHDIGLDKDGIITVQLFNKKSQQEVKLLLPELEKIAGVESVSASRFSPGSVNWHQTVIWEDQVEKTNWNLIIVDENFLSTFDIELTEGDRSRIADRAANSGFSYIINEAALKVTGWESGLGRSISPFGRERLAPIVGVAKDFNYKSLHNIVEPCILVISDRDNYSQISLRYSTADVYGLLADIESKFLQVLPSTPFEYAFASDQFDNLYQVEKQTSQLIGLLTGVAITLALLGVYALLSFTIRERTKELAIRKVLGIKIKGTIYLLSSNYLKLLLIANVIGIPAAWYIVSNWLQNFSYQIALGFGTFLWVGILTLSLIFLVVGLKVLQTEKINPTEALRNE